MPASSASDVSGRTPTPTTTKSASSCSPLRKLTRPAFERSEGGTEVEDDAMLLVDLAHEVSDFLAEQAFHRARLGGDDDMHFEPARPQ
jgi:hypothetical protein